MITEIPYTDACPHCGAELYAFPNQNEETYWRCGTRSSRCLEVCFRSSGCYKRELAASKAEVERLRKMVIEAARKGDELLEPYRLRAEKAETLIKQIHAFAEAINPTK